VIIRCLTSFGGLAANPLLPELRKTETLLTSLCSDVCASISFHTKAGSLKAVLGHSMIWPLYAVATTANVSAAMRSWVISQLREISYKTAILQGIALADELSTKWEITRWERLENDIEDDHSPAVINVRAQDG
jgi:hypothetical protein